MAIAIVMDFKGGTLAQYDKVIKKMGFKPGGKGSPEAFFHWVTKTPDGIRVTDVWKTKAAFEKFAQEQIGPVTAAEGMAPPAMQFFDVHNHLVTVKPTD